MTGGDERRRDVQSRFGSRDYSSGAIKPPSRFERERRERFERDERERERWGFGGRLEGERELRNEIYMSCVFIGVCINVFFCMILYFYYYYVKRISSE